MAQSAKKNLATTANHQAGNKSPKPQTSQYENINTNKMTLLDTLKSMTNTCNKRMQDVNDCRDSHRDMLEAGQAYPANCKLERMDRMATRAKQYWQRMKDMWQNNDAVRCPKGDLDEIAVNVTNLGDMVDQFVKASKQYSKFYRQTGKRKRNERTRIVDNDKHKERQQGPTDEEDEYRSILYFDAVSLKNRGQAQTEDEEKNEESTSINHAKKAQAINSELQRERDTTSWSKRTAQSGTFRQKSGTYKHEQ
jgi:hypothetical protein